ncbi:MAG: DUF4416 family protein [Gemmataceae bacterium]
MANPRLPPPGLLLVAAFSRHPAALAWARPRLEEHFGPIGLTSAEYAFDQTSYYAPTMGGGLRKVLWAFDRLLPLDALADAKLAANALEREAAASGEYPDARPLNLDPGTLVLGKFLLATTKDQAHRIYLRDGIFAEVTLQFRAGTFAPWPWTYADYRLPEVIAFLNLARAHYRQRLASADESYSRGEGPHPS